MAVDLFLEEISVVVTAEFHNPSILNHNFLVSEGIVPEEWEASESISTPPFSQVNYSNGILWTVDQSRLTVQEICQSEFRDTYHVHDLAIKYLNTLRYVPYRDLGLNCVVSVRAQDPPRQLTARFLNPVVEEAVIEPFIMEPRVHVDIGGPRRISLTLNSGTRKIGDGEPESALIISNNVHHQGPHDAAELRSWIGKWPEIQVRLIRLLNELLGDETLWSS